MNIYVSNMGVTTLDAELKTLFEPFGIVSSAKVIMDRFTNQSRGYGFVEMPDSAAAQNAIQQLNGKMTEGAFIKVSEARTKEERSAQSSGRY